MAFEGAPREAVEQCVGDQYIQHNPLVVDGKEGFINYFERMAKDTNLAYQSKTGKCAFGDRSPEKCPDKEKGSLKRWGP